MKRDWKLIRKIICNLPGKEDYEQGYVLEHYGLCVDRGLIDCDVLENGWGVCTGVRMDRLTREGHEMAALLFNEDHLNRAIQRLDLHGIGHTEELITGLIRHFQKNELTENRELKINN